MRAITKQESASPIMCIPVVAGSPFKLLRSLLSSAASPTTQFDVEWVGPQTVLQSEEDSYKLRQQVLAIFENLGGFTVGEMLNVAYFLTHLVSL